MTTDELVALGVQAMRVCPMHPGGPLRAYERAMRAYLDGELDDCEWVEVGEGIAKHFLDRIAQAPDADTEPLRVAYAATIALFYRVPDRVRLAEAGVG